MASASFVEIISHFAGYLQIFHDIARDRSQYDETLAPGRSGDYTTPRPDYDHRFSPDDMGTKGGFVPELIADDVMDVFRGRLPKLSRNSLSPDTDAFPPALNPKLPMPTSGGGGGSGEAQITVTYREGGEETQLTVDQYNFMNDNDTNLPQEALAIVEPLISSLNNNAFTTLENLVANANAEIPTEWWMTKTDGGAVEFISAHDAAWAERDGTPDQHSVAPGYYVNGELEEPPVEPTPPAEFEDVPDTGHAIGQWASMGSNESINAALIADIGEGVRTMMVMEDYYKTDAIFQTNTIVDEDEVHVSGGEGEPSVTSGDNVATNIADFVQYASIYADLPTFSAGPNWIVDKVEGDYYSVHAVTQTNYLSDNDVATQVSANSHYNIVAGHNQLGNVALIVDGEIQYDLIIIQGSYHGMNVIFQNNILLNNDNIVVSADGADPSQSVNSGNNSLSNEGTIENYGGYDLREMIPWSRGDQRPAGRRRNVDRSGSGQPHRRPWRSTARALCDWRLLRHQCGLADQHHLRRQRHVPTAKRTVGRSAGASSRRGPDAVGQYRRQPAVKRRRDRRRQSRCHLRRWRSLYRFHPGAGRIGAGQSGRRRQRRYRRAGN